MWRQAHHFRTPLRCFDLPRNWMQAHGRVMCVKPSGKLSHWARLENIHDTRF